MNKILMTAIVAGIAGTASADVINETNSAALEWGVSPTNGGQIDSGAVTLFPSGIAVAGANGPITDVNVTLNVGSHSWADDMEIVLRSPAGTVVALMQDAGGNDNIAGDLTFDDQAAGVIADAGTDIDFSGSFQPSVYGTAVASPAPAANAVGLSAFNGEDANGTWDLFVYDDANGDFGSFAGGWTLDIVTVPAPASAALLALGGIAATRRRR